jgi:hypothetical protein
MRINPTNQPRLRTSNPRIHGKWPKASGLTQIVKKLGGPPAPSWSRKTTTPVGEKRETKLPNKRKNVESQGKVLGPVLELPFSISCLNRH